eukprot:TRINITY_DN67676_c2_g1_i1.p1 TRINITY_DN67676_c2_g1~~TRINITY_DN67676_c2_g1_i1.p1  ORF type:complete len:300 (-),score=15.55 TRINITY_DN67676_c2_g1_i1:42-941(-)
MEDAVVIDTGSSTCKAGYAGDDTPRAVFPTVVGHPTSKEQNVRVGDWAIGRAQADQLHMVSPVERGHITDWESMESLWHHAFFSELRVIPSETAVLLAEPPLNPRKHREKATQVMFETFEVPALHLCITSVLAVIASGRSIALVLEVGDGLTTAVPIYESRSLPPVAIQKMDIAGRDLTNYMAQLLGENGHHFAAADHRSVRAIKEATCFVATNFQEELTHDLSSLQRDYQLPDSTNITVTSERFWCPEALFNPSMCGFSECPAIHQLACDCINKCDADLRKTMYMSTVLAVCNETLSN